MMHLPALSKPIFDRDLRKIYIEAVELNEARRFDDAYRAILEADAMMLAQMRDASVDAAHLDDSDFVRTYYPIRKSLAEIAYKLGLFSLMETVSADLSAEFGRREVNNQMLASLAKINAGIHFLKGEYGPAREDLVEAMNLWEYDWNFTRSIMLELAQLYYVQESYEDASGWLDRLLQMMENEARHTDRLNYSDSEYNRISSHKALCLARLGRFDEAVPLIDAVRVEGDAEWMRRKAKILMLEYEATGVYNPEAKRLYQKYLSFSRSYVEGEFVSLTPSEREQYWLAEKSFVTDCYRLEDKAPELIYDVALFSKAVMLQLGRLFGPDMTREQKAEALAAARVTWKDVQRCMPENSAAVEYVIYDKKGRRYLGAAVLNKKAKAPVFVEIAPVPDVSSLYFSEGRYSADMPSLLWNEGMVQAVDGCQKIYFAADGILHQIPLEFIVPKSLEEMAFYRLTSTRLLAEPRKPLGNRGILLAGGVDYTYGKEGHGDVDNDAQAYSVMSGMHMGLRYLKESKNEVEGIMEARDNGKDTVLLGYEATENAIRSMMNQYDIVHIATHGYFADGCMNAGDIVPMVSDRQLSRSCLFLSESQENMNDSSFDPLKPDGILSARELAAMDLGNVGLVVLSACRSGLGYVTEDGVFGLQRGLKSAGAGAMVVSLWDVSDMAASVFFKRMYGNLDSGMTVHQAFSEARQYLKTAEVSVKRRRAGLHDITKSVTFNMEKYYNAFILIDGLE